MSEDFENLEEISVAAKMFGDRRFGETRGRKSGSLKGSMLGKKASIKTRQSRTKKQQVTLADRPFDWRSS